jgi:sigma-B regulation protein RsbU (phosphoserine phosphatase)
MAVARTLFLTEARYHIEPLTVMHAVHRGLIESSAYEMFVTAIYGVLDPVSGEFTYVRGGHEEPLYIPRNGEFEFLSGPGRFLGLWPDPPPAFEERQVSLHHGDVLVLYSDGVTDMRNGAGEFFGRESVARLVSTLRTYDAERLANSIYHVVRQHRGPGESFDDFTLLVIKVV